MPLAGGQSLMPMLNFRVVAPDHLIDLNRIAALSYIDIEDGVGRFGAMTRQRDLEFSADVATRLPDRCTKRSSMSAIARPAIAAPSAARSAISIPRPSSST